MSSFERSSAGQTIRILFVTRKWAPAVGGMETWSMRLSEELAKLADVELVALPGRADGSPPGIASLLSFAAHAAARILRASPAPDIVQLGDMAIWPLGLLARLRGARVAIAAHGTDVSYHRRKNLRGLLYGAYLRLGSRLLGRALLIANSRATAEAASETGWHNATIIPLATDMQTAKVRDKHDGTILFAGRLVERKGCGWFVREVLPLLPDDIRLAIAGTRWHPGEDFVLAHPRVSFLGPLSKEDLAVAFATAMCVVVPNIEPANGEFEGFGLVAAEAAAAGGIVLASDHAGLREAVIDGETGFLLPMTDAQAWAGKIREIAEWDPSARASFSRRATAAAQATYNWQRVARQTLAAYRC